MTRTHTVLFVDDEDNILSALKRTFRRDAFDVLTAEGGEAGLELLRQHDVSVIVSDQRMPGMIGAEFLSRSRELRPHAIRLMLTGYSDVETATQAINEGGIHRFVTKPWDDTDLRFVLHEAIKRFELEERNRQLSLELQAANEDLERRVEERTREVRVALEENRQLTALLQRRVKELEGRDRIARQLLEFHSLEDNLEVMAQVVCDALEFDDVAFFVDDMKSPLVASGGPVAVPDVAVEQMFQRLDAVPVQLGDRRGVLLPILRGKQLVGAIAATCAADEPTDEQLDGLRSFSLQAAIAISDDEAHRSIDEWSDEPIDLDEILDEATGA